MDAGRLAMLAERLRELPPRGAGTALSSGSSFAFHFTGNSSSALDNDAIFGMIKSTRIAVIVLACIAVVVAFATIAFILRDSILSARWSNPQWTFKLLKSNIIGSADIYPLVLSFSIIGQGASFATIQSMGLQAPSILECTRLSQLTLPAFVITPFIQFVFGLETIIRALRGHPATGLGKWSVPICLVFVGVLLSLTFALTFVTRPSDLCFASLLWLVQRWRLGCFGLLLSFVVVLLAGLALVFLSLRRASVIDPSERVFGSRMLYYMTAAVLSMSLMLPFFGFISFNDPDPTDSSQLALSLIASVATTLTSLTTGGLYLFLRSSSCATVRPEGYHDFDRQEMKKEIRVRAPSHYMFTNQIQQPLSPSWLRSPPPEIDETWQQEKPEKFAESQRASATVFSAQATVDREYSSSHPPEMPSTPSSQRLDDSNVGQPRKPKEQAAPSPAAANKPMTPPPIAQGTRPAQEPPPVSSISDLLMPPAIFAPTNAKHRRDSSQVSSATVQIGLRLSNFVGMRVFGSPRSSQDSGRSSREVARRGHHQEPTPLNVRKISPLANNEMTARDDNNKRTSLDDCKHKTLPPIPSEQQPGGAQHMPDTGGGQITLSPTVYSPQGSSAKPTPAIQAEASNNGLASNPYLPEDDNPGFRSSSRGGHEGLKKESWI